MLQLDPASSVPLYQQIRDQMRQLISTGALPLGERLPPSRELAQRLGVHRTTVANAYAELTAEELFPVEDFRRATSEVLRREGKALLQLGSSDGYPPLKEFLRGELRRDGIQAGDRELLITNGCQQALDLVRKVFLRPGDVVAMENPVYPGAIQTFTTLGLKCLGVPVDENGLNLDVLESVLAQQPVRLLLVTPSFQNPTGTTLSLDGRKRLLALAARHQVPVVEDNIYARLRFRGRDLPSLKALDTHGLVIHLNSFSKVCFPGLRVGWVVAREPVIERLRIAKQATDLHTDQLAQAALAEFGRP